MEILKRLLGRADPAVPRVETDDIFPIHLIDQAAIIRASIISYTFRYNDQLDPKKLQDALCRLLEVGDWRKFGGRLRLNVR